jgi:hypothetical protein
MTVNVLAAIQQRQRTEVKDGIMSWLRRCLQEDVFSDCYIVTSEGVRVPAHKGQALLHHFHTYLHLTVSGCTLGRTTELGFSYR